MALKIVRSQDFWTGVVFVVFGGLTVALSSGYSMGTAARMGPGYFPNLLGWVLIGIGALILLSALAVVRGGGEGEKVGGIDLWLMFRVLASVAAFGLLLGPMGLMFTAFVTVLVAAWAGHEFNLGEGIVSGLVLAGVSWLLFVVGLGQSTPVLPWFLSQ